MTTTRDIIERIWPTTTTQHHHDGPNGSFDYDVVHSDRPRWARLIADYGIRSWLDTELGWARHHAIRAWLRVGMKLTHTELSLMDVWVDYYGDNTPEEWPESYTDEQITLAQEALYLFLSHRTEKEILNDMFGLK